MKIDKDLLFCLLLLLLIVLIYPSLCQVESFVLEDYKMWRDFDLDKYENLIEEWDKIKKKISTLTPEEKTMVDKEKKKLKLLFIDSSDFIIEIADFSEKFTEELERDGEDISDEDISKFIKLYDYYEMSYVNEKLDSFIDNLISKRENKELEEGLFDALW